jgi:hypothetical protein
MGCLRILNYSTGCPTLALQRFLQPTNFTVLSFT